MPELSQSLQCEDIEVDEHRAIRALSKGEATEHQQRLALEVIVKKFSRANDLLYVAGSFDQTSFLNGRAYVGKKIQKYTNLKIEETDE